MIYWSLTDGGTLLWDAFKKRIGTAFLLNYVSNHRSSGSPLNLFHDEDLILVKSLVQREFSSLPESLCAALIGTLEGLLTCVDISMFLEILAKCKLLVANHACKSLGWCMRRNMSSKGKSSRELLVTIIVFALVGSFHGMFVFKVLSTGFFNYL